MSGLTAYAFFPPPSIRPSLVNQSPRNPTSRTFRSIHFHRLAYTESQATPGDNSTNTQYDVSFEIPAQDSGVTHAPAKGQGDTRAIESVSGEAFQHWHSPTGYGLPAVGSGNGLDLAYTSDSSAYDSKSRLIAAQTAQQHRSPRTSRTSLSHSTPLQSSALSRKRKSLEDSVPDSTTKEATILQKHPALRLQRLADEIVDTPEQQQPRNPLKTLHPSPSTPLNRPAATSMLLVRETEKRVQTRSKMGHVTRPLDEELLDVELRHKRVRHVPSGLGCDGMQRDRSRVLGKDNSLELPTADSLYPLHGSGRPAGRGIITSTQKDATHLDQSFFGLSDETTTNWPASILAKADARKTGSLGDISPEAMKSISKSSPKRSPSKKDRLRAQTVPILTPLDLSFSTDGSKSISQPATMAATAHRDKAMSSTHESSARNCIMREPEMALDTTKWSDSWEATPTGQERMVSEAERTGETISISNVTRTASGRSVNSGQVMLTGSTESDMFTQTLNPTGKSGSGLFTSQSQSICTFPSYLAIPVNTLTDLTELLNMPLNREARRVDVLAVVWEVGQVERYSERCEVQLCQPVGDDVSEWGMRKTLLRVEFWDEFAQDVKRLKPGDVVWIKNLDHKSKADKDAAYRTRPRYISTVSSRRPGFSCPTNITIMYRAMPDRYIHRGPVDRCQECAAAGAIRDVVRHDNFREGEDTDAVCQRHKGAIAVEDHEYRLDRRLLESEIGMRRVKKLVEWVETTFTPRAGYQADKYRLNAHG